MKKFFLLFFLVLFFAGINFGQSCPDGMISYWKLDDESASTVKDSYGTNDGHSEGDYIPTAGNGIVNGAFYFDGNDVIVFQNEDAYDWTKNESFSVEIWVKTNELTTTQVFISRYQGSGDVSWWLGYQDNKATFSVRDSKGDALEIANDKEVNDNQWHHVVGIRDYSTNTIRIYVDSEEIYSDPIVYKGDFSADAPVTMGAHGGSYFYKGWLDEAAIYNKALTPEQVQDHYEKGLAGLGYCDGTNPDKEYILLADKDIKFYSPKLTKGNIHANGDVLFGNSCWRGSGNHSGNVSALRNINVLNGNEIDGDLTAGRKIRISRRARVTGDITEHADVEKVELQHFDFRAGGKNVYVRFFREETLEPGSYNNLRLSYKAKLHLKAGDYYFNKFDTDLSSKVIVEGPVNIYVVRNLDISYNVEIELAGNTSSTDVNFYTLDRGTVRINHFADFSGNLYAPRAQVVIGTSAKVKGSIEAESINIYPYAQVVSHSSNFILRKAEGEEEFNEADYINLENNDETATVVEKFEMEQNYPNPFNPSTTIRYAIPEANNVRITVYNVMGEEVTTLVDGFKESGYHEVKFDASHLSSGIYIYRIEAGSFNATKKMQLLK